MVAVSEFLNEVYCAVCYVMECAVWCVFRKKGLIVFGSQDGCNEHTYTFTHRARARQRVKLMEK